MNSIFLFLLHIIVTSPYGAILFDVIYQLTAIQLYPPKMSFHNAFSDHLMSPSSNIFPCTYNSIK